MLPDLATTDYTLTKGIEMKLGNMPSGLKYLWLWAIACGAGTAMVQADTSAEDLIRAGKFDEARILLETDTSPRADFLMGHTWFHAGAAEVLNIDLPGEAPPRSASASRGNFPYNWDLWRMGDYPAAREYYDRVIGNPQADSELIDKAIFWRGLSHVYEGNFEAARADFHALLERPNIHAALVHYAWQYIAHTHLHQQNWHEAREAYVHNIAAPIRPLHLINVLSDLDFAWRAELSAARAALFRGDAEEAVGRLQLFLDEHPLPQIELTGNQALRIPEWDQPFSMRPRDHAEAMLLLGDALRDLGDKEGALEAWHSVGKRRAPAADDDFIAEARLRLAQHAWANGETDAAADYVAEALSLYGTLPQTRIELLAMADILGVPVDPGGYGAELNPTGQPIGGGLDYTDHVHGYNWKVADAEALAAALAEAAALPYKERKGKIVKIDDAAEIDITGIVPLVVPDGITLAGDRGDRGAPGPRLFVTDSERLNMIQMGSNTRLSGIRVEGAAPTHHELVDSMPEAYPPVDKGEAALRNGEKNLRRYVWNNHQNYGVIVQGEGALVDNCEFSRVLYAVSIQGPYATVRHNWIHNFHSYGVIIGSGGHSSLIEANLFDWAWHAIATGSGLRTGNFEARYNIFREMVPNGYGEGMSQVFAVDAHAQGDRFLLHHNTFLFMDDESFGVPNRSVAMCPPWELAQIFRNRFVRPMTAEEATYWLRQRPVTDLYDLYDIVTARDIFDLGEAYLRERYPDMKGYDFRGLTATNRQTDMEIGGHSFWVYDNAYGPQNDILPYTDYTTPRIQLIHPQHRRPRNSMPSGRGGDQHPPLDVFSGILPVDFAISTVPGIGLRSVEVELVPYEHDWWYPWDWRRNFQWRKLLWQDASTPAPGELTVDTTTLDNGVYGIFVTATDDRGHATRIYTYFEVINERSF